MDPSISNSISEGSAVSATSLSKDFPGAAVPAVQSVSLELARGRFVGFEGPAGAGKTTLLRMIAGRLRPSRGVVSTLGLNPIRDARKLLQKVAWVPGLAAFPTGISLREVARLCRDLGGGGDSFAFEQICTALQIDPNHTASRLNITENFTASVALALQKSPNLMIMDIPESGDFDRISQLLRFVNALKSPQFTLVTAARRVDVLIPHVDELRLMREGSMVETVQITRAGAPEAATPVIHLQQIAPALPEAEPASVAARGSDERAKS